MKYTTVLFDADNTLLDFTAAEAAAFRKTFNESGICLTGKIILRYNQINHGLWQRFERNEISKTELVSSRFVILFEELGINEDGKLFNDKYFCNLSQNGYTVMGAEELCAELRRAGVAMYIITNGVQFVQLGRLENSGLRDYFKDVFVSEAVGIGKPSRKYFDYVLDRVEEKDKSKILVVGDSLSTDIAGGAGVGLDTCFYNPLGINPSSFEPTYTVSDLCEIREVCFNEQRASAHN